MSDTYTAEQCVDYEFNPAAAAAPEGFNADSESYRDAPVGDHLMELVDFEVCPEQDFRIKGDTCVLDQLRPKFRIVDGQPDAGATVMDFLPMPSGPMLTLLANRWGHFLKRLGFTLPAGQLLPAGFKLNDLIGKHCLVSVELATDGNGVPKLKNNGRPRMSVAFFGYGFADAKRSATTGPSASSTPRSHKPTPQPVAAAASSDSFVL